MKLWFVTKLLIWMKMKIKLNEFMSSTNNDVQQIDEHLIIFVANVIHVWCNVTIHDFLSCLSWLSCPFWLKAHGLSDIYIF